MNDLTLRKDHKGRWVYEDEPTHPSRFNCQVKLGFNSNDELICIEKVKGSSTYRRMVTDTSYTGGTDYSDITRWMTFDTWSEV